MDKKIQFSVSNVLSVEFFSKQYNFFSKIFILLVFITLTNFQNLKAQTSIVVPDLTQAADLLEFMQGITNLSVNY